MQAFSERRGAACDNVPEQGTFPLTPGAQDVSFQRMTIHYLCASLSFALIAAVPSAPAGTAASATPSDPGASPPTQASSAELPAAGIPGTWIGANAPTTWQAGHLYLYECWATWCGPCIASMPHLEELHRSLAKSGNIHILGLNVDNDMTPDRLAEFISSKLHITFPVGLASEQTQRLWLHPLDVRVIPFAFAVRDSKVVWKGSPRQLSVAMLTRLAEGQPATVAPPPDPVQRRQDMLACVRGIFEALARRDLAEAKRIAAEEDARNAKTGGFPKEMTLFLLRAMVSSDFAEEAAGEARHLAKEKPQEPSHLLTIARTLAGPILKSQKALSPSQSKALETALDLARQASEQEEKAGKTPRITPLIIAGMFEKLGRNAEAKPYLLQAIERSEYGRAWNAIQQETQERVPLAEILEGSVKAVIALEKASPGNDRPQAPDRWHDTVADDPLRAVFEKTEWKTAFKPQGAPADGTLLICLKRSTKQLDAQLRLRGWNRPTLYRAQIVYGAQLQPVAAPPESSYPVGHLADTGPLLNLPGSEQFDKDNLPEVMLWRDGHLLWHGEIAFMPHWLGDILDRKEFDFARFQNDRAREKEKLDRLRSLVGRVVTLNKEEKWDEARTLLLKHLDEFYADPGMALFAEEQLSGRDFHDKNYAAVCERFQRLMKQFPLEFLIYSNINKMLNSSDALQQTAYSAAMQALQGMADTNLRADPEYNAACYAVMARLALDRKQYARARELGMRALATSELARRYLGVAP